VRHAPRVRRRCRREQYTSIPQRSKACQILSIASLPAYTAYAKFFLIVTPTVIRQTKTYDLASYQRRGAS
jgi:hypothetical protein